MAGLRAGLGGRDGSRMVTGGLAGVLALTVLAACTGSPVARPVALSRPLPAHARRVYEANKPSPADARACGPMNSFPRGTADEIMSGRLTIAPFPAFTIDPHRNGDINWKLNPYHDPTWVLDYQWGEWIEALIEGYLAGGPKANAYRSRAKALLLGWLKNVPIQDKNPLTAICSAEAFPGQAWIHNQIPVLVDYYAAHWQGAYNHGLSQDLILLGAGCAYPASLWGGRPLKWRETARQQMIDSFEPNQYGPAVDAQGVTNEQATGYANFTFGLWTTAERQLTACGYSLPGWITSRIGQMPLFLALATQPDGKLVQIGDTYVISPRDRAGTPLQYAATKGTAGKPPARRIGVYSAGYVFGRSGWGTAKSFGNQSFYSLRFGPGRQIHGHDDHMGLTYYARGRNLIVDSGHDGYANNPYRQYLLSPEAASVMVMPGERFNAAAPTSLVSQAVGAEDQFFEFTDTAFGGLRRYRSVYVSQRPDFILVLDRAKGASSYQQLWHLDPGLTVTSVSSTDAIAAAPGTQLEIRQIPLPGQVIPDGSTRVVRGQTNPYQGWVSHADLQRIPASVVTMTRVGPSAAMLTLIAPTSPGAAITTAITQQPGGLYQLRLRIGGSRMSLLVSPTGTIRQG